ncbi:MAG: bacteriohemerythrin [Nitrospiraceae bacterium]|nr:bacteriohemerythrin [Nitrospiraceae bacterium]
MKFKWTDDLSTGIEQIDRAHIEMFATIDRLAGACKKGKGKEEISETLRFLNSYIAGHFGHEERQMADLGYQSFAMHKSQHDGFVKTVQELQRKLESAGPSSELAIQANIALVDWLVKHIISFDKSLGLFLKSRNK